MPRSLDRLRIARRGLCLALAGWLALAVPSAAIAESADPPEPDRMQALGEHAARAFDAAILRPLGAGRVAVGFGFFVASSPLLYIARTLPETWEVLVIEPYEFIAARPLGEL